MKVVPRKRSCVLWDGALAFLSVRVLYKNRAAGTERLYAVKKFGNGGGHWPLGGRNMNFGAEMMPGITLLVVGAFLGFFADGVCRNKKNVQPMRMLGTFLAFAGAILVFIS